MFIQQIRMNLLWLEHSPSPIDFFLLPFQGSHVHVGRSFSSDGKLSMFKNFSGRDCTRLRVFASFTPSSMARMYRWLDSRNQDALETRANGSIPPVCRMSRPPRPPFLVSLAGGVAGNQLDCPVKPAPAVSMSCL